MKSRPISVRLSEEEVSMLDGMATQLGVDRTTLLRRAVKHYGKSIREKEKPTVVEAAKQVVVNDKAAVVLEHPFARRILQKGIKIHDNDGKQIAEIRNLVQLLNFVSTKVFSE